MKSVQLKPGKEDSVRYRHPWVFSGAIERVDKDVVHGDVVGVLSSRGEVMGMGGYSAESSIAVRMVSFVEEVIDDALVYRRLEVAWERRKQRSVDVSETAGYRWVFGEVDNLPGLVVDVFAKVVVIQISTMMMERMREAVVAAIEKIVYPVAIVERSDVGVREQERLIPTVGVVKGQIPESIVIKEHGCLYEVDVLKGQKTGFFLDQREARKAIGAYVKNKKVLNVFSYTGSFGVAALKAGARQVTNIDSSATALAMARVNMKLNGFDESKYQLVEADVFEWFESNRNGDVYDVVIIDPPALIKSRNDYEAGKRAYRFLAGEGLKQVTDGGVLLFSSCSRYLSQSDLEFVLRQASVREGRVFELWERVEQAKDHPMSLYYPESAYLKSVVGRVSHKS